MAFWSFPRIHLAKRIRNMESRIKEEGGNLNGDRVTGKIRNFSDLLAWQEARSLVLLIYKLTQSFPRDEVYGLISQMKRCSISVTSNIAEGFSRTSFREKAQFYAMAAGSLTELESQMMIAEDLGFVSHQAFIEFEASLRSTQKMLHALLRKTKDIASRT